jgi:hypothetical protein
MKIKGMNFSQDDIAFENFKIIYDKMNGKTVPRDVIFSIKNNKLKDLLIKYNVSVNTTKEYFLKKGFSWGNELNSESIKETAQKYFDLYKRISNILKEKNYFTALKFFISHDLTNNRETDFFYKNLKSQLQSNGLNIDEAFYDSISTGKEKIFWNGENALLEVNDYEYGIKESFFVPTESVMDVAFLALEKGDEETLDKISEVFLSNLNIQRLQEMDKNTLAYFGEYLLKYLNKEKIKGSLEQIMRDVNFNSLKEIAGNYEKTKNNVNIPDYIKEIGYKSVFIYGLMLIANNINSMRLSKTRGDMLIEEFKNIKAKNTEIINYMLKRGIDKEMISGIVKNTNYINIEDINLNETDANLKRKKIENNVEI